jgi:hypothetical protein
MSHFRSNSFRRLKLFIGEATAHAAGSYIAISEIERLHQGDGDLDPWATAGERHSVKVNGLRADSLLRSTIRLSIVGIYSGFDSYVDSLKPELLQLKDKSWVQHDGESKIDGVRRNFTIGGDKPSICIQPELACLDYYRLIRNAVAHRSEKGFADASGFYDSHKDELNNFRSMYRFSHAPNRPDGLTYHDVKALARCALGVGEAVDSQLDPGDEKLADLIPKLHRNSPLKEDRLNNAAKGWLRNVYGVSEKRAIDILRIACYTRGGL